MKRLELEEGEMAKRMSVNLTNSILNVYRDEKDNYFTYLSGYVFNVERKEKENKFYTKRKIKFANGKEVKNKSKIKIIDGFASPYKLKFKNDKGEITLYNGEMYYITDFELIEDGIDEKQKIFNRQNQAKKPQENISKTDSKLNSFSFNEYSGVTPF